MMTSPAYKGFFINLERSVERRKALEAEIARLDLGACYQRFTAAEDNALHFPNPHNLSEGALGCFTSHTLLLKQNLSSDHHLHIIEDDVIFASCLERIITWVISSGFLDAYDIIYTDLAIPLRNALYKSYKQSYEKAVKRDAAGKIESVAFDILDVRSRTYSSTSSFLINRRSIKKLHDIFESELVKGASNPIDLVIREKNIQGALNVGCIFPFVTSLRFQSVLSSAIDPGRARGSELISDLARILFFIDSDWDQCQAYLDRYAPRPPNEDKLAQMLGQLLTHSLSDDFSFF